MSKIFIRLHAWFRPYSSPNCYLVILQATTPFVYKLKGSFETGCELVFRIILGFIFGQGKTTFAFVEREKPMQKNIPMQLIVKLIASHAALFARAHTCQSIMHMQNWCHWIDPNSRKKRRGVTSDLTIP